MRNVLEETLGDDLVKEAEKQAQRSTMNNFRTGAILFDRKHKIIGKGCSHATEFSFTHAEHDALNSVYDVPWGSSILIVTLGKTDNYAYSSRPCLKCANRLHAQSVQYIFYAERLSGGEWIMNMESPSDLIYLAMRNEVRVSKYAKDMRIAPLQRKPATI